MVHALCISVKIQRALPAALLSAACIACSEDDGGVTYSRDVQPIFEARCTVCHHSQTQAGIVDIEDAFTQDDPPGLVGALNPWEEGHPGYSVPYTVVPFDPENSFLMRKITDEQLRRSVCETDPDCPAVHVGNFMPKEVPRLSNDEIGAIRQWIADGASEDVYRTSVAPIFGTPFNQGASPCAFCHYPGTPNPPSFVDAFDPNEGLVNVPARFRPDLMLVEPGNPDASFLIMKIEATEFSSDIGAPMPRNYPALSAGQVAVIERWIAAGAKND